MKKFSILNNFPLIIFSRLGSSRLKKKAILKVYKDLNLLEFLILRIKKFKNYKIVIATTNLKEDKKIIKLALKHNVNYFKGSVNNVTLRYYNCMKKFNFKIAARITADNPLTDIKKIKNLINIHIRTKRDYSSNYNSLNVGEGTEIFNINTLKKILDNTKNKSHLEHVNEYILNNKKKFKIYQTKEKKNKLYLTVDTIEDLKKIKSYIKKNVHNIL